MTGSNGKKLLKQWVVFDFDADGALLIHYSDQDRLHRNLPFGLETLRSITAIASIATQCLAASPETVLAVPIRRVCLLGRSQL
jgi:hypothetical protein